MAWVAIITLQPYGKYNGHSEVCIAGLVNSLKRKTTAVYSRLCEYRRSHRLKLIALQHAVRKYGGVFEIASKLQLTTPVGLFQAQINIIGCYQGSSDHGNRPGSGVGYLGHRQSRVMGSGEVPGPSNAGDVSGAPEVVVPVPPPILYNTTLVR